MATYKVIQDIEAEDKLVGPLSLRQFIYALVAGFGAYLSFLSLTKGGGAFLVVLLPITIFTGFFAFPWGRDQPTEIWALAKIRYLTKPRRRIWDQSGVKNLVNITAPKHIEKTYTNGLSLTEVESRLSALANTLDSRGWAIKNVNVNLYDPTRTPALDGSDRLVDPASSMPQEVSPIDITTADDMLDEVSNPSAQRLNELMTESTNNHRQQLINQLRQPDTTLPMPGALRESDAARNKLAATQLPPPADYWFLNGPVSVPPIVPNSNPSPTPGSGQSAATPTPEEEELAEKLRQQREKSMQSVNYQHMKVIQPLGAQTSTPPPQASVTVTPPPDPATIELANRDDLNIATIARIANKEDEQPDEVVISLHNHSS